MKALALFTLFAVSIINFPIEIHAADGDSNGKIVFGECKSCHELRDKENRIGPHLVDLFGRKAGTVQDFPYSDAMLESAFTWNERTLNEYITAPEKFLHGTRMYFSGILDPRDREDLIAFLKTETASD